MKTASWVIRDKATGRAVFETFNPALARAVNPAKFEAVPILEYLQSVNRYTARIRALESEGLSTSDAQAIADSEGIK